MFANLRMLAATAGVLASLLACHASLAQEGTSRTTQDPMLVRHTEFGIPFQVATPHETPEVQLMVSNDRGANWVGYQRQAAQQNRFMFQAHNDGEYWFAIRTFDSSGRPTDTGSYFQPELKVAVDTRTPVVTLNVEALESGEVIAKWTIRDSAVDPSGIHLSYQTAPNSPFQQVEVDASKAYRENGVIAGETRWFPFATERVMLVRIDAYDKAGNVGVAQQSLSLPLVATRPRWNGVARQAPGQPSGGPSSLAGGSIPVDPFQKRRDIPAPPTQSVPWPTNNAVPVAEMSGSQPGNNRKPPEQSLAQQTLPQQQQGWKPQTASAPAPQSTPSEPQDRFRPASMQMEPPVANSGPVGPAQPPVGQSVPDTSIPSKIGLPPGVTPQFINHKGFALNYGVDTVGPSGIGQIELWVTRDAGQTWEPGGIDPDRESPFDVEVKTEGMYGFRIVVEGGNGLTGRRPQPGDLADIWVNVDLTNPVATITNVVYGEGAQVGHLDISWSCSDAHLAARPISLYYSNSLDGPWKPIAEEIANSGRYVWKITPEVPHDIFLKVTAADEAGNMGEYVLKRAIANDGLVPRATIRSLQSAPPLHEEAKLPVSIR